MTGWSNGLSQDYNKQLGTWFADRLGARNQLRRDMETKNEALELAREIEQSYEDSEERAQVVAMLRSQAAEIDRLNSRLSKWSGLPMKYKRMEFNAQLQKENDQLKDKNKKLVEALKSVVNVGGLAAASVAEQALKENT